MKYFLLLLILVGCGRDVRKFFGVDYEREINKLDGRLDAVEDRIAQLETIVNHNIVSINELQQEIDSLDASFTLDIESLQDQIDLLQAQTTNQVAQIAALQSNENIVEFIDPCGDGPGFDEVVLKTSSNKLIVYFESGSRRFLTILTPGAYITTDQQACRFTVNAAGQII